MSGTLANTVTSWSDAYETKVIVAGATENISYYFANKQLIAKKDKDGNKTYIHADHLGSTNVVTNQAGGLVEATKYDPWGQVKSGGTANKFLYTGQEKDGETGLMYYNARYYSPEIRRFIQPDPLLQNVYVPQSLNRYSYVLNNPLRYTDPTGNAVNCTASGCYSTITVLNKSKPQPKPVTVSQFVAAAKTQNSPQKQTTQNNTNNSNTSNQSNKPSSTGSNYTAASPIVKAVVNRTPAAIDRPIALAYAQLIGESVRQNARDKFYDKPYIEGGEEDAWRHARFMEILTQDVGAENALIVGGIHEVVNMTITDPAKGRGFKAQDYKMDLYNNYVGAKGATQGITPDQLLKGNVLYFYNR